MVDVLKELIALAKEKEALVIILLLLLAGLGYLYFYVLKPLLAKVHTLNENISNIHTIVTNVQGTTSKIEHKLSEVAQGDDLHDMQNLLSEVKGMLTLVATFKGVK